MTTRFDMLLEQGLLQCEIGLGVKEMAATTAGQSLRALGASALDREAALRPKPTLTDDLFHTLKPPQIFGVVIWKIKRLCLPSQWIDPIMHVWPLWVVRSVMLGILRDINESSLKKMKHSLLTILTAERASSACFRWLGALLNMKRPWARPFALPSNLVIARLTWVMSSFESKYPSQFLPGLNTTQASL